MMIKVISYSYTGNNEKLANAFAREFFADHIRITEKRKRTMLTIALDYLFRRDPKINKPQVGISSDELAIFFGPIWFGRIASPMRSYLKQLENKSIKYGFISLCVGSDDSDAQGKLIGELRDVLGNEPEFFIEQPISNLLPADPEPTHKTAMQYRVNDKDIEMIIDSIKAKLKNIPLIKGYLTNELS
jgi:flavodoxin